ncbi:ABC transporter substrate-binding protein [Zooshikella sp. RANM57]|uniref:ABC transporter substrate-binding protein n=1 Tax=Zooshikella sp. RANM57 TaxID=3425863 RepID=UPI003D6DD9F8
MRILILFVCLLLSFFNAAEADDKIKVVFVSCCLPEGFFWPKVEAFMRAAADDLNIELEVLYAQMDYMYMKSIAVSVANRQVKPDYLIIDNYKLAAGKIIKTLSESKIKIFLMANGLTKEQASIYGNPREIYPNWIGELTPDNYYAGYQLAKSTIDYFLSHNNNINVNILALSGDQATPASIARVNGLKKAISHYQNVVIKQVIPGNWQQQDAYKKTYHLIRRYPDINVVWAANDEMALGAMESVIEYGKQPGKDIYFSGINWKKEALKKVQDGSMVVSIGGHFMMGGWALVILHDYHFGIDFAQSEGLKMKMKLFNVIDVHNVQRYLETLGDEQWQKINFKHFSKRYNSSLTQYDFSLNSILHNIEEVNLTKKGQN